MQTQAAMNSVRRQACPARSRLHRYWAPPTRHVCNGVKCSGRCNIIEWTHALIIVFGNYVCEEPKADAAADAGASTAAVAGTDGGKPNGNEQHGGGHNRTTQKLESPRRSRSRKGSSSDTKQAAQVQSTPPTRHLSEFAITRDAATSAGAW